MTNDPENKGEAHEGRLEGAPLADRGKRVLSDAEQRRRERAAAKLRENLARRKQQSRARRAGEAEDGVGLPAAQASSIGPAAEGEGGDRDIGITDPAANSSKPGD